MIRAPGGGTFGASRKLLFWFEDYVLDRERRELRRAARSYRSSRKFSISWNSWSETAIGWSARTICWLRFGVDGSFRNRRLRAGSTPHAAPLATPVSSSG